MEFELINAIIILIVRICVNELDCDSTSPNIEIIGNDVTNFYNG